MIKKINNKSLFRKTALSLQSQLVINKYTIAGGNLTAPAFGLMLFQNNQISPKVFVRELDSFVEETACGSGSVAFSIYSGASSITQPTGQKISVIINKSKNLINISATVRTLQ